MAALDIIVHVLDRLTPLLEREVNLYFKSEEERQRLVSNLNKIIQFLEDAERKQWRNRGIKLWLEELQGVAYDVEDALDNWEAANCVPISSEEKKNRRFSLFKTIRSLLSCFKLVQHRSLALDVRGLNEAIEEIYTRGRNELQLLHITESIESRPYFKRETVSTSDFVKSQVHGRDMDKERVRIMLSEDQEKNSTIGVVCVIGQGGIGKTTLARMIYHDKDVESEFPVRLWITANPFNQISIANQIFEELEGRSPHVSGLEALRKEIKRSLREKPKFLLVLDDLWIEEHRVWDPLKACLSHGAQGSKILVTTRKQRTVSAVGATQFYELQTMGDEDCWSIVRQTAFANKDIRDNPELEEIGRKIVRKCNGSPLAAQFLGGLLLNKSTVSDFRQVLESEIWNLEDVENRLFRHFFLSYYELEPAVRRCFSYCALLPKDYDIDVDDLIRIWMAQGFLSSDAITMEMEMQGRIYFDKLAQHSFFQDFEKDEFDERVIRCKMHDIVHDFAQYLTKNECATLEDMSSYESIKSSGKEVSFAAARHLSCLDKKMSENHPVSASILINTKKLRSFYCFSCLTPDIVVNLKSVRLLSLIDCSLKEVPGEIGNLIHLRYLSLRRNNISLLHEGICNLSNLQTLDLGGCDLLSRLPQEISKLLNMRHLLTEENTLRNLLHPGIASLTNLQTLTGCLYAEKGNNYLGCLKDLHELGGTVVIRLNDLDEEADVNEAKKAALTQKNFIQTLRIQYDDRVRLDVVEALQPHPGLQHLYINAGGMLPSWITTTEYLRKLTIVFEFSGGIPNMNLPPLGKLRCLIELHIEGLNSESVGHDFLGLDPVSLVDQYQQMSVFPSLKTLRFVGCLGWRKWNDINENEASGHDVYIMPRLQNLELYECPDLEVLPHRLIRVAESLETLIITGCPNLVNRYKRGAEHEDTISHIENIKLEEV